MSDSSRVDVLDPLDALDAAAEEVRRRLALVEEHQWTWPTPCEEWDVRFLVVHVVGGNRFAALVLDGEPADTAYERVVATEQLGAVPLDDFTASAAGQRAGFGRPDALDGVVRHPAGDLPVSTFLERRVADLTVHAWDLASAIGADTTLGPPLVATILSFGGDLGASFGIEALDETSPDGLAQDRLLHRMGRRPGWSPA